ncbi:MAG: non-ribosomal peptide synthetase, partial [Cyanobacteriota bacterium]
FEEQAERTPDAVALVFEEKSLSYAELNASANRLAHHLITQGIRPDDRVAIGVERSLEMVVGLLAILKAGGAYVPLDPAYPEERLAFMLEDSAPVALLVHAATRERFTGLAQGATLVDLDADAGAWSERSATNPNPVAFGLTSNHLAYVIYTSGSTGKPKGVAMAHQAATNLIMWLCAENGFNHPARALQFSPLGFDVSFQEIFSTLCCGGALILIGNEVRRDSQRLLKVLADEKVERLFLPFIALNALAVAARGQWPTSLREVVTAGEQLRITEALTACFANGRCRLHNHYGPTETHVATAFELPAEVNSWLVLPPIGRPIANTRIYVLDGDGQPVPIGVAGELHIGGAGVARGYLNRSELTAERFLPDPFVAEPEARMYRTGDLARWLPDGNLDYIGRIDFQVKIRGFRIELGEIEAALRDCTGIREAVVLAREDSPGEKRLVAYVTTDVAAKSADMATNSADGLAGGAETIAGGTEAALLPAVLKAQLRSRLPDHMLPAAFVVLESFPLTPNGKLDRKALPAPEAEAYALRAYAPPEGPVEEALAALWRELLGIKQVGRHDDFFALGGHSLLAVSLVERMRRLDMPLDVRALFTTPTLAELAAVVGDGVEVAVPPNRIPPDCTRLTPDLLPLVTLEQKAIDQIVATVPGGACNVQDIYPLGPLQEGLLFHHLLQEEGDAYVLATVLRFDSRAGLESFLSACQAVINRHDIFRTAFAWEGLPEPVQVVWRNAPLPIEEVT